MADASIQKLRELSGRLVDPEIAVAVFEALPDAVLVLDDQGLIQLVNRHAELLFAYPRYELFGRPAEVLMAARYAEAHRAHRARYMQEPWIRTIEMAHTIPVLVSRKCGEEFMAEIVLTPIPTALGLYIIAVVRRERS